MHRRDFLNLSVATATLLLVGCSDSNTETNRVETVVADFTSPLAIPTLLEGENINNVLHFDLNLQKGTYSFFEGTTTNTYGINGALLGPTLKIKNGDDVSLNYTNNLDEEITMHGHGLHLPAIMDGAVHQLMKSGESWSSVFTVKQNACTSWYHPHTMGKTAEQVYKGLAGVIIIEDDDSLSLDIPKTYGSDDIPLVLQDKFFDSNQEIDYSPSMMEIMNGYNGDIFLINGIVNPYVDVQAKEIRFRVLNGSNSSVYNLGFDDGRSFKQIATDNSFLESPVSLSRVVLSPGERAEIVVDFSDSLDKEIFLVDFYQNKNFMKVNVIASQTQQTTTPQSLTSLTFPNIEDALNTRTFRLSGMRGEFYINNLSMDKDYINEVVPLNQLEVWEVINEMNMDHNFHMHATHFVIAERNGSSTNVPENEKGYKDTVFIPPNERVKLLVKMTDYADEVNPYMYHCHFLEHDDAGMMGQFSVST